MTKRRIDQKEIESYVDDFALKKCIKCTSTLYKIFTSIKPKEKRWKNNYKCPKCYLDSTYEFLNDEKSIEHLSSTIDSSKKDLQSLLDQTKISDILNKIFVELTKALWDEIPIFRSDTINDRNRGIDINQIRSLFYLRGYIKKNISFEQWVHNNWENGIYDEEVYKKILTLTNDIVYYLELKDKININSCVLYTQTKDDTPKLAINSLYQSINLILNDFGGAINMEMHKEFDPSLNFTGDVYAKARNLLHIDHEIDILLKQNPTLDSNLLKSLEIQYDLIQMSNQIIAFPNHENILNLRSSVTSGITSEQLVSLFNSAMRVINYNNPHSNKGIQLFQDESILNAVLKDSTFDKNNCNKIIFSHDGENRYIRAIRSKTDLSLIPEILPIIIAVENLELDEGNKVNGYFIDVLYMVLISSFLSQFTDYYSKISELQHIKGYDIFEKQILPTAFTFLFIGQGDYFTWDEIKKNYSKLGFTSVENMKSEIGEIDGIFAQWGKNILWVIEAKKSSYPLYGWVKKDRIGFNIAKIIGHIKGEDYSYSKIRIGQNYPKYYVEHLNKTIKTKVDFFKKNMNKLTIFGLNPKDKENPIQIQGFIFTDLWSPIIDKKYENITILPLQILLRMVYNKQLGRDIYK